MDQGYKHFSHAHNLILHHLPEGVEVSCFGCNSSGSGSVFVCWQCNFFLHEQCYRAARSLKHPSHPPHPLTLVPYPTYPSNSFYCNSCEIIGTGFSYSCADCEFDLHVQCAYSISRIPSFHKAHHYTTNYYSPDQELVPPGWNGQNSNMTNEVPFVSAPDGFPNPLNAAQNHYMAPNPHSVSIPNSITGAQYHSTGQDLAYISIPPARQNSFTTAQDSSTTQNIPTNSQYPITSVQYPSMAQTVPPDSFPSLSQNPITSTQYSSMAQTGSSVSIPTNSHNSFTGIQYSSMTQPKPSVSILVSPPNPVTSIPDPSMSQNGSSASQSPVTSVQYPSLSQDVASVSVPTKNHNPIPSTPNSNMAHNVASISLPDSSPHNPPENHVESGQNQLKDKGFVHFSHPHKLFMVDLQDEVDCSGCEEDIVGKGYSCTEEDCNFHLHESCFHLWYAKLGRFLAVVFKPFHCNTFWPI